MAWSDLFTGRKAPLPGVPPQPADGVRQALLALDRPTAPFTVRPATEAEGADLVAEWRIVDARWFAVFAAAGLEKTFAIHMRLHADEHEVRTVDHSRDIAWQSGMPVLTAGWSVVRGRQVSFEFGRGYAFTEELRPGEVYRYRFASSELRQPLQACVNAQGWSWRAAGFDRL